MRPFFINAKSQSTVEVVFGSTPSSERFYGFEQIMLMLIIVKMMVTVMMILMMMMLMVMMIVFMMMMIYLEL